MQFLSTLSVLVLAATATASEHNFHARLHRRNGGYAYNESTSAVPELPSSSVTPVDVPSSSAIDFTTLAPIATGVSEAAPSSSLQPGEEVVTETVDSTLTYTLGYGSSATVITTTIQHTTTRTVTRTVVLTRPTPEATGVDGANVPGAAEPTTTVRQTSTLTKVVTVYPVPSQAPGENGDFVNTEGAANPTGACVPATTVYVTEQETVYVTLAPSSEANVPVETKAVVPVETEAVVPVETEAVDPVATPSQNVELPLQSSSGGFYPTGVTPSGGYASSSGFHTTYTPIPSGHAMPQYGAYRF